MRDSKETLLDKSCQVCGDPGFTDMMATCFKCRETQEHIYCMRVQLSSVPTIWLCEDCRSFNGLSSNEPATEFHIARCVTTNAFKIVMGYDASQPSDRVIVPRKTRDAQDLDEPKEASEEALTPSCKKVKLKLMDQTLVVVNSLHKEGSW